MRLREWVTVLMYMPQRLNVCSSLCWSMLAWASEWIDEDVVVCVCSLCSCVVMAFSLANLDPHVKYTCSPVVILLDIILATFLHAKNQ